MSDMIERVARAICEAERMNPDDALGGWVHWQEAARAAIEAMREPSEEMLFAGHRAIKAPDRMLPSRAAWLAMIDVAVTSGDRK
jgi:hypothetical protein